MALSTRNLSITNVDGTPSIALSDQECLTTATSSEVIAWLMACVSAGTLVGIGYRYTPSNDASDGWFHASSWLVRALFAFAKFRSYCTPSEDSAISTWLMDQATFQAGMSRDLLDDVFPNRLAGDYSVRLGVASSGAGSGYYLHKFGQEIPSITMYYNNRRATCAHFFGQAGIYFGDSDLVAEAKRYFKEWVMFGVWEHGEQSEWQRAEDYGIAKQGLVYGITNIACALEIAARLAAAGDRELADFTTTYGLFGTSSTAPKSIYTALDLYVAITQGGRVYYTPAGNRINWWDNDTGLACQWQYCLRPLDQLGMIDKFSTIRQVTTPSGWAEDHYYAAWRGMSAIYQSDVRVGLPPVIQARLG